MRKKKKATTGKITIQDYIKAVKKADRDIQLSQSVGGMDFKNKCT